MSKPSINLVNESVLPEFLIADDGPGERDFVVHCRHPRYVVEIREELRYNLHCIDAIPEKEQSWRVARALAFFVEIDEKYEQEAIKQVEEEERNQRGGELN